MDLKNLREKVFEKNLGIGGYFSAAFDLFKIILKEDKMFAFLQFVFVLMWFIGLLVAYALLIMFLYSGNFVLIFLLYIPMFFIGKFALSIAYSYFVAYFFRKVALKVEGKDDKFSPKGIFTKALVISGIGAGVQIILFVLEKIPFIGSFFNFLVSIGIIVIFIWALLYFCDVYYIRDFALLESFDYSLELSKGNRLKKIITGIILAVGIVIGLVIIILPFSNIIRSFSNGIGLLPLVIIFSLILSLIFLYCQTIQIVIFLNVENSYLQSKEENSNHNFENREEIDYTDNQSLENIQNEYENK